ncbi:hypothetical protein FA13DRAFT_1796119 [Coprinellus micaceus]|uniref:Uncharacterized protein n=1 Tax=Coprinellus micaceus TaxID=71717 RepID=A0A4Y7SVA7_COPMI|nr:hypothetical protein FA13DRAFT_1796119 [Coprinellus micaceus]
MALRTCTTPPGRTLTPTSKLGHRTYAQGGTDPAGAVYFISVPGVKPAPSAPAAAPAEGGAGGLAEKRELWSWQGQQGGQQQPQQQPVVALVAGPHAKRYQLTDTGFLGSGGSQQQPEQQRHDSGLSYCFVPGCGQQPIGIDTNVVAAGPVCVRLRNLPPSWVLPKRGGCVKGHCVNVL